MKKLLFPLAICSIAFVSFAFTGSNACDENDMFKTGTEALTGYFKADGTQTGTGKSTVQSVTTSGDSTIATLLTSYTDTKNPDKPHDGSVRFICVGGKIIMDMSGMMNSMPQSGKDMKVVMTGNMVPYKTSYAAGERLEDVKMNMQMFNGDKLMMTSDILVSKRVCEAVEDRTTPAGTFHCYKISSVTTSTTKMGQMTMPGSGQPTKSVQWFSTKAGVVRMENYKDDAISSYSELQMLKTP